MLLDSAGAAAGPHDRGVALERARSECSMPSDRWRHRPCCRLGQATSALSSAELGSRMPLVAAQSTSAARVVCGSRGGGPGVRECRYRLRVHIVSAAPDRSHLGTHPSCTSPAPPCRRPQHRRVRTAAAQGCGDLVATVRRLCVRPLATDAIVTDRPRRTLRSRAQIARPGRSVSRARGSPSGAP